MAQALTARPCETIDRSPQVYRHYHHRHHHHPQPPDRLTRWFGGSGTGALLALFVHAHVHGPQRGVRVGGKGESGWGCAGSPSRSVRVAQVDLGASGCIRVHTLALTTNTSSDPSLPVALLCALHSDPHLALTILAQTLTDRLDERGRCLDCHGPRQKPFARVFETQWTVQGEL